MTRPAPIFAALRIPGQPVVPLRFIKFPVPKTGTDRAGGLRKGFPALVERQRGGTGGRDADFIAAKVSNGAPHSSSPETAR